MARLALFACRRTLRPWCLAGLLGLSLLAARGSASALWSDDEAAQATLRALGRENVWSVLLVLAPFLLFQAAGLGAPAATAWLAPTPASRLGTALALVLGCAFACGTATLLTALVSEATSGAAGAAWRRSRTGENPPALLLDDAPRVRWSGPTLAPGERLRLWTTVAIGSGPAVTARFRARAGDASRTVEARVAGRTALELAPPRADGTLELELERVGPGALLVLPPGALEVLAPARSERLTALTLGGRVFLLLASGCALALGLGRALRPTLAAGLVSVLLLASWTSGGAERWVPGADLPRAWQELAGGLVPASPPLSAVAGALAMAAMGLWLLAGLPSHAEERP
jgi:hypothetical protein